NYIIFETGNYTTKLGLSSVFEEPKIGSLLKIFTEDQLQTLPLLFVVPSNATRPTAEEITKIIFEEIKSPLSYILNQAMAAACAGNSTNALIIDVGFDHCVITPVLDGIVMLPWQEASNVGSRCVIQYLEAKNIPRPSAFNLLENEFVKSKTNVLFNDSIKIFFEKSKLMELFQIVMSKVDLDKRSTLCEAVIMTGGISNLFDFKNIFQANLKKSLSDNSNDFQIKEIKYINVPEYFGALGGKNVHASFIGGCILSKMVFGDSKYCLTRQDYNDKGPSIIHSKAV
ncbi:actin-like ATPase domain-containing protein, partial [Rozella allomycis CSF55]